MMPLQGAGADGAGAVQELEMSTRNGALPYSIGAQGFKARDRPLLFGGHLLHMPEAIDWWDAAAEGLYMALLALEHVAQRLFASFAEQAHLGGFQRLARSVAAIVTYARLALPEVQALQGHCTRCALARPACAALRATCEARQPRRLHGRMCCEDDRMLGRHTLCCHVLDSACSVATA